MSEQMLCGPGQAPSSRPPDFHFQELLSQARSQNGAEPAVPPCVRRMSQKLSFVVAGLWDVGGVCY